MNERKIERFGKREWENWPEIKSCEWRTKKKQQQQHQREKYLTANKLFLTMENEKNIVDAIYINTVQNCDILLFLFSPLLQFILQLLSLLLLVLFLNFLSRVAFPRQRWIERENNERKRNGRKRGEFNYIYAFFFWLLTKKKKFLFPKKTEKKPKKSPPMFAVYRLYFIIFVSFAVGFALSLFTQILFSRFQTKFK